MPQMGFEHVTPPFEWTKRVHDWDRTVNVIGLSIFMLVIKNSGYPLSYLSWKKPQDIMSVEVNLEMTFSLQQAKQGN